MTDTNSKAQVTEKMVNAADSVLSRSRPGIPDEIIALAISAALAAQEKPEPGVAVKATPDMIDEAAKLVAKWIGYSWDGLRERDISDEFPDWATNGVGTLSMQGGKPALRKLAAKILAVAPSASPAIPDGWKLVPVEPTFDMVTDGRIVGWEVENCSHVSDYSALFRRQWARTLAVAPSPNLPEGEVGTIRQRTIEECAKVADAEMAKHNTGSGFDSQPAHSAAFAIATAIRSLGKEGSGE